VLFADNRFHIFKRYSVCVCVCVYVYVCACYVSICVFALHAPLRSLKMSTALPLIGNRLVHQAITVRLSGFK